jgi:patatin-like phospholipase/acyl hydrolase
MNMNAETGTSMEGYRSVIIAYNNSKDDLTVHFRSEQTYKDFRSMMRRNGLPVEVKKTGDWRAEVSFLNHNQP